MPSESPISSQGRSFEKDYEALSQGAWIDFSTAGKIEVTGQDRLLFLHSLLTQDLKNLRPGQTALAAMLLAAGKTLFLCEALVLPDKIILLLENSAVEKALALLERFIITEDIALKNISESCGLLIYSGARPESEFPGIVFPSHFFLPESTGFLFEIHQTNAVKEFIAKSEAEFAGLEAYEMLRIEKGVLRYGKDLGDDTILSEAGLDHPGWVSETKGCYPGQEVIAKIKTYKGLKRKIRRFRWDGAPAPSNGSDVFSEETGQAIGGIRSAAQCGERLKGAGWCYLPATWNAKASLFFKNGQEKIRMEISKA